MGDVAADAPPRALLPPQGVHPNNAIFGAPSLPKPLTWQRREHIAHRRTILARIGHLLARNAQLVLAQSNPTAASGSSDPRSAMQSKTWALARKLEVLIFIHSASLLEYVNMDSLSRRVQALTAGIVNKKIRRETTATSPADQPATAAASNVPGPSLAPSVSDQRSPSASSSTSLASCGSREPSQTGAYLRTAPTVSPSAHPSSAAGRVFNPASAGATTPLPGISHLIHKRSASEMESSESASNMGVHKRMRAPLLSLQRGEQDELEEKRKPNELGVLLFRGYEELSKIIWSYVDGAQIMRSRGVCQAARSLAPQFVTSLQLSCNAMQMALGTRKGNSCILRECVHLRQLEIVSLSSGMTFGKLSMRATNCPQRFVVTHDDHEQIVLALAEQMRSNAFPGLTRLGITCLFTNEEADGEADVLLNNLMLGCCPQLEELCLPGNSFGDYGAAKVAQMLRSQVCPKLTRLDLRRNFIGEDGVRSLCHALADGCAPNLVELCLGGNTITDSSFHHVLYAMESRKLCNLRFLGIEMNYLTSTSMEMLGRTIGKLVCPVLSQISYNDNSVDNASAKRLIATSVYQERVWQAKRQQQIRDGLDVDDSSCDEQYSDGE